MLAGGSLGILFVALAPGVPVVLVRWRLAQLSRWERLGRGDELPPVRQRVDGRSGAAGGGGLAHRRLGDPAAAR